MLNKIFKLNQNRNKFNNLSITTLPNSMCQSITNNIHQTSFLNMKHCRNRLERLNKWRNLKCSQSRHRQDVNCQVPKNRIYNSLSSQLTSQQAFYTSCQNDSNMYAEAEMSLKVKIILKAKTKQREDNAIWFQFFFTCFVLLGISMWENPSFRSGTGLKWFNAGANGI